MKELTGKYFFKDQDLLQDTDFDDEFLHHGINVYEVLRQRDGTGIFLEAHLLRLTNSAKGKNLITPIDHDTIKNQIKQLSDINNFQEGNIKIVLHSELSSGIKIFVYPIKHTYPEQKDYLNGVKTISLIESRPDPNLKNWRPEFRQRIAELKSSHSVFEIMLINENGIITEGSQSNIFFIKNDSVFTSERQYILPGITRDLVLEICNESGISAIENSFYLKDLLTADTVFLTGTSPKIIPVSSIDNLKIPTRHPILNTLIKKYDQRIEYYLKTKQ